MLLLCIQRVLQGAVTGKALHKTNSQAAAEGWNHLPERLFNMQNSARQHTGCTVPTNSANPCSSTSEGQQTVVQGGREGREGSSLEAHLL